MSIKRELYTPITEQDVEFELPGQSNVANLLSRRTKGLIWTYLTALHVTLVLLAASVYTQLHVPARGDSHDLKLWPAELPFAYDYVEYETVIFAPSGFNDIGGPATEFEGRPTPERDALWYNLTKVGMASLTEDEYNQLDITTIQAVNAPEQRLVTIEVFHQLHCLNYLRRRLYEEDGQHFQIESDWSREAHLSHCIDYLRQVLMCHGDLTPITLDLAPGKYKPNFSIKHSCRNWDRIYEFATERNISGTGIE